MVVEQGFKPIPKCYSQELANLVTAMLLKDPQARPTADEIVLSNIVQEYMALLIQESCDPGKVPFIKDKAVISKTPL